MILITELEILRSEAGYGEETKFPFIILEFFLFALLYISIITQTPPPPTPQEKEEGEAQSELP